MKILVFDDSHVHRMAAELSLKGHDLTVVGTYDEAQSLLNPKLDYDMLSNILKEQFGDFSPYRSEDKEKKARYFAAETMAHAKATTYPDFDVVLTDLLVPASDQAQGSTGEQFVGKEMPLGTTIALLALIVGIKKVAIVTDMNHHNHPASAAFDCFNYLGRGKLLGISIICTNHVEMLMIDEKTHELVDPGFLYKDRRDSPEGLEKYPYSRPHNCGPRIGLLEGKNWKMILERLLNLDEKAQCAD